jgi:hypothetical protein
MDSLKNLQAIRIAMLASVVLYGVIVTLVPSNGEPNPIIFYALAAMAIAEVAGIFAVRRIFVFPRETAALPQPEQGKVLAKPGTALLIIYCMSEVVACMAWYYTFLAST